jgi:hypothetical protein
MANLGAIGISKEHGVAVAHPLRAVIPSRMGSRAWIAAAWLQFGQRVIRIYGGGVSLK